MTVEIKITRKERAFCNATIQTVGKLFENINPSNSAGEWKNLIGAANTLEGFAILSDHQDQKMYAIEQLGKALSFTPQSDRGTSEPLSLFDKASEAIELIALSTEDSVVRLTAMNALSNFLHFFPDWSQGQTAGRRHSEVIKKIATIGNDHGELAQHAITLLEKYIEIPNRTSPIMNLSTAPDVAKKTATEMIAALGTY